MSLLLMFDCLPLVVDVSWLKCVLCPQIEALQEVLEKLKNKQLPSSEKKLGWVSAVRTLYSTQLHGEGILGSKGQLHKIKKE